MFARFPFVDVAFGPGQVQKLAEFLTSDSLSAQGFFEFEGFTGHLPGKRARDFQAWVQISVGCNSRCSYCIVPSTRGREVSRPADELVEEVRALAADGVREVTLLGQNVNSYGRDLRPTRATFAELLERIDAIDGIERIRYTSPHPKDMREDVIRAHAELASVCEHIHLPLQSGSSRDAQGDAPHVHARALPRPRRADPRARARRGDHDRHHRRLPGRDRGRLRRRPWRSARRSATTARSRSSSRRGAGPRRARSPRASCAHEEKVERMQRLVEVVQRRATERAQRFVGRSLDVLVEGTSRTDPTRLRGRSRHNKAVNFSGLAAPGEIVPVQITGATSQTLIGELSLLAAASAGR